MCILLHKNQESGNWDFNLKKNYDNKWDIGKISEIKINFNL